MIRLIINNLISELTQNEKKIGEYILSNLESIPKLSSTELALKSGVSQSQVIKFIKKIGIDGFVNFKLMVERELATMDFTDKEGIVHNDIVLEDSIESIGKKLVNESVNSLNSTLSYLDFNNLEDIVKRIKSSRNILILGVGVSSIIAQDLEIKLIKIKLNANHYGKKQIELMKLPTMSEEDLIIAISHSGETSEILDVVREGIKLNIPVVSITSIGNNSLSKLSYKNLGIISKENEFRTTSSSSRITQMILIDMIYMRLLQLDFQKNKKLIKKSKEIIGWTNKN